MPLFEVDARRSTLVQPLAPADAGFVEQAGPVVDDHVSRLLGEQLFTVASREPGTRPEDAPHLLALDASGQPVVIEMVSRLDAGALALALAHAGRAARLSRADVADRFPDGAREFERAFAAFQDGTPIARTRGQREGSRLLLLCAQVDPAVADALEFLRLTSTAVSVLRLGVVTGPDGRRLVEVEPLYSAGARRGRTNGATSDAAPTRAAYRAPTASPTIESPAATAPTRAVPPPRAAPTPTPAPTPATAAAPARAGSPAATVAAASGVAGTPVPSGPVPTTSERPASRAARTRASRSTSTTPAPTTPAPRASAAAETGTVTPVAAAGSAPASPPSEAGTPATGAAARSTSAAPSPTFVPRTDAQTSTPLPMRSRAARRRDADVVSNVFARPEPDDHATSGLDASTFRGRGEATLPDPLADRTPDLHGSSLPPIDLPPLPPVDLPGPPPVDLPVDGDEDPDLSMLAAHLGRSTTLVWARPRRGQSFRAQLLPTGQIELPGVGLFRNPDAAASAAIGHDREDGWDVWRVGDNGPSLTEVFREQFA
ncbi:hypothetical protein [Luteimicrobium subarcticum]|uniref:RAMA domain-containing protein n=1 Tax=Luteimicrobium subarcticum TaxID=620910 RepID=A0A2M8WSL2_9MICO|nr:hypothetical protein [Luteimicrobium subarcticum]PJI93919.1 hypothetical protein CLV34_1400 [Luteimicrobium subarcticum]